MKNTLNPNTHFIIGWGVDKKLYPLAKLAMDRLEEMYGNDIKIKGWQHPSNRFGYYHPFPRTNDAQLKWVDIITNQILENNN